MVGTAEPNEGETTLGEQILTWCRAHPSIGRHKTYSPLALRSYHDGSIGIEGTPPDVIALSMTLLTDANLRAVTFDDGVLTIDIAPDKPLRYQALGPAEFDFAIVFERIKDGD
jgi:hypothetical protein